MNDDLLNRLVDWAFAVLKINASPKLVSATKSLVIALFGFVMALASGYQLGVWDFNVPYAASQGMDLNAIAGTAYAGGALTSVLLSFCLNLLLKLLSK